MIKLVNVTKKYHYEKYATLENLSVEICTDEKTTLLMETQSGKTTLAKILTGVEKPDSGEIFYDGKPLEKISLKDRNIAYFPTKPLLFEKRSVFFNLAFPLRIRKIPKDEIEKTVIEAAEKFGFDLKQKVKTMSEQKKYELCAARASLRKPKLIILDDYPPEYYYTLDYFQNAAVLALTSKTENALGKITVIKDNAATETDTKERTEEYIKNTVWLTDELIEETEENS